MALITLTREEFQTYSDQVSSRSFMQSVQMGDLLEKRGVRIVYLALKQEGEIQVAALVYSLPMLGGLHMELNSGPIYTQQDALPVFYEELKEYAKQNGVLELLVKPYETYQTFDSEGNPIDTEKKSIIQDLTDLGYQFDGLTRGYPNGEVSWHYIKDLKDYDDVSLLKTFNKNSIRNIQSAFDFNILIRNAEREEIPTFKKIIEETGKRQGFEDKNLDYYFKLYDMFGDKADFLIAEVNPQQSIDALNVKMASLDKKSKQFHQQYQALQKKKDFLTSLDSESGNVVLACALIIYTNTEATYLFGGSYAEYQKFSAPFLLQYHAMKQTMQRNIHQYNFLGIQGIFDGSDGVLRFKQNFNGYIVRKAGTFRYHPSPLKYKAIQLVKKILGR
ncbi:femAB family protein [Streptococcus mitis]|uniref:FemAB family protein n=1 Tax=Streptococcus mitis TaxID=28037 RepID=A0A081QB44_STRMT|nr:aminoacyltransferase [Streptococcus mitis]KEQ40167.1 femAB family protein [Streptococcus mitis]